MLERKPIFPNVIEINMQAGHVLGCNVYLVYDEDEWVLIDIGYLDTVDEIIELIRQLDFPSGALQDAGRDPRRRGSHTRAGQGQTGFANDR